MTETSPEPYEFRSDVEAVRLGQSNWRAVTDWCHGRFSMGTQGQSLEVYDYADGYFEERTHEPPRFVGTASMGDWIVRAGGMHFQVWTDSDFHRFFHRVMTISTSTVLEIGGT